MKKVHSLLIAQLIVDGPHFLKINFVIHIQICKKMNNTRIKNQKINQKTKKRRNKMSPEWNPGK